MSSIELKDILPAAQESIEKNSFFCPSRTIAMSSVELKDNVPAAGPERKSRNVPTSCMSPFLRHHRAGHIASDHFPSKWPPEGPQDRARHPKGCQDTIRKSRFRFFSRDLRDFSGHPTLEILVQKVQNARERTFFRSFLRPPKRHMLRFPTLELDVGEPRF